MTISRNRISSFFIDGKTPKYYIKGNNVYILVDRGNKTQCYIFPKSRINEITNIGRELLYDERVNLYEYIDSFIKKDFFISFQKYSLMEDLFSYPETISYNNSTVFTFQTFPQIYKVIFKVINNYNNTPLSATEFIYFPTSTNFSIDINNFFSDQTIINFKMDMSITEVYKFQNIEYKSKEKIFNINTVLNNIIDSTNMNMYFCFLNLNKYTVFSKTQDIHDYVTSLTTENKTNFNFNAVTFPFKILKSENVIYNFEENLNYQFNASCNLFQSGYITNIYSTV